MLFPRSIALPVIGFLRYGFVLLEFFLFNLVAKIKPPSVLEDERVRAL